MARRAETIRQAYAVLNERDFEGALGFLHPDVEWVQDPNSKFERGTYRGRKAVRGYWRRWFEAWDEFRLEPEKLVELPDGRVLVDVTFTARGGESGLAVEFRIAQIITMRDEQIVQLRTYLERAEAVEAAGLHA